MGTLPTSTEVVRSNNLSVAATAALDSQLIGNAVKAFHAAEKTSGQLISDVGVLAGAILDLHEAGTWERTIDGVTGKLYSSPKAFYSALFDAGRFPLLHRVLRNELIETLMDGEKLAGIGTNELAAILGCSPAQITRAVAAINAAKPADDEPVLTDEQLDDIAAEAAAEAEASGADEAAVRHAAEAARAEAKRAAATAEAEAEAEAKLAAEKAEAEAERKVADRSATALLNAASKVDHHWHLLTDERKAEVRKALVELPVRLAKLDQLIAEAEAEAGKPKPKRQPKPVEVEPADAPPLDGAPADPTSTGPKPKPSRPARRSA